MDRRRRVHLGAKPAGQLPGSHPDAHPGRRGERGDHGGAGHRLRLEPTWSGRAGSRRRHCRTGGCRQQRAGAGRTALTGGSVPRKLRAPRTGVAAASLPGTRRCGHRHPAGRGAAAAGDPGHGGANRRPDRGTPRAGRGQLPCRTPPDRRDVRVDGQPAWRGLPLPAPPGDLRGPDGTAAARL